MLLLYLVIATIAAFVILIFLGFLDIVIGLVTGKEPKLAKTWGTIIEAILGFAAAAGAAIAIPALCLIILLVLFMGVFG